jgi:hypothetical protein
MGEAKRRATLGLGSALKDSWAEKKVLGSASKDLRVKKKVQANISLEINIDDSSDFEDAIAWKNAMKKAVERYPLPINIVYPLQFDGWDSMANEYLAVAKRKEVGASVDSYQEAELLLMEYCLDYSGKDFLQHVPSEEMRIKARKAGTLLNNIKGRVDEMYQSLYLWIPKAFHREIDIIWDGIGGWKG